MARYRRHRRHRPRRLSGCHGLRPKHHHYDPDSKKDAPSWFVVDVKLVRKFKRIITLDELRTHAANKLEDFVLLRRGNRLS